MTSTPFLGNSLLRNINSVDNIGTNQYMQISFRHIFPASDFLLHNDFMQEQ